jgi:hypothetical protein
MANIIGTKDNDLAFLGTPKNDTITGLGGADHLQGLEGTMPWTAAALGYDDRPRQHCHRPRSCQWRRGQD